MYAEVRRTPCNLHKYQKDYWQKIPQTKSVVSYVLIIDSQSMHVGRWHCWRVRSPFMSCHVVVYDMEEKTSQTVKFVYRSSVRVLQEQTDSKIDSKGKKIELTYKHIYMTQCKNEQ